MMATDRLRNIYTDQRSVFNGSLNGRLSTRPVLYTPRGLSDADSGGLLEDENRTQFYQETFTVYSSTDPQIFQLYYLPLTGSEHVYWKPAGALGIYLEQGPDWQVSGVGEFTVAPGSLLVGDEITVEYAYREPVDFQPVVPMSVGTRFIGAGYSSPATSIALPTGTKVGDLLTLGLISGFGVGTDCPDSRMTLVDNNGMWGRGSSSWVGYASNLSTPLSIFIQGNYNVVGQFAMGYLIAWRSATGGKLEYNLGKVARVSESSSTTQQIPGIYGNVSGGICCFRTSAGFGGVYGYQDWNKAPAYTGVFAENSTYVEIDYGLTTRNPVPAQTTPNTNTDTVWVASVIGLK